MKDAVTGENERLKELGITASKEAGMITYHYTDSTGKMMEASVEATDRIGIQAKLMEIFNEKYGGAMEKLSSTWGGMISNVADIWTQFQLAIMSAGLFDWMKEKLKMVLDTINQLKQSGELDRWAASIGQKIQFVLESAWNFATNVFSVLQKLGGYLKIAADYVGGWERLGVILAGMAFAPMLISTAAGLVQIALGLTMLTTALMANPIVLIIAAIAIAIAAAAYLIYANWDSIVAFFVNIWNSISAGAKAAWASIKEWLGFDPVAALSSAWSSISTVISDAWASLPPLTWDNVLTALDWLSWLSPLRWLDFVPGFSWSGIITGTIDWAQYIASFEWSDFLPSFSWPEIKPLDLPEMPDIAGWIGGMGDKAMAAIEGLSSRLGSAWSRVRSAFSFGASAKVDVMDPATIQAAQAATAALKADMQAVAATDTTGAMGQLARLDAEAGRIKQAVTNSVQQAQSYLAGVSLYNQGAALMDTMAAGIRARAVVVIAEIQKMAQAVRDHLPSSPAKVGPLSDIHRLKFGETIASSIRPAPMVKAMRGAAAATMAAASISGTSIPVSAQPVAGAAVRAEVAARSQSASIASGQTGGGVHIEYKPTLQLSGDAKSAEATFRKELDAHARHIAKLVEEERRKNDRKKA
ncbi:hypothetical protein [Phyllobacterium leguminum]|nr:hypothetical protein [Phyllobacterium leguminum]